MSEKSERKTKQKQKWEQHYQSENQNQTLRQKRQLWSIERVKQEDIEVIKVNTTRETWINHIKLKKIDWGLHKLNNLKISKLSRKASFGRKTVEQNFKIVRGNYQR